MKIGERLRILRFEKDLTLEEVGRAIGTTKQTLYKYENGIITNIPSDKIEAIARLFDVSPAYIMGWEEDVETESYYLDPETAKFAEEAFKDPQLRLLFSTARNTKPEDLEYVIDLMKRLNKEENKEPEDYPDEEYDDNTNQEFPDD